MKDKFSPNYIESLEENEVFVFGSNWMDITSEVQQGLPKSVLEQYGGKFFSIIRY